MKMKNLSIAISIFLITGCATVSKTYTSNGEEAYTLNCSGTARGWDTCFKAAGNLCGTQGYNVLEKSSEDTAVANANNNTFFATKTHERSMLISCKKN